MSRPTLPTKLTGPGMSAEPHKNANPQQSENLQNDNYSEMSREEGKYNKAVKPPIISSLISMCNTVTCERADLIAVDRTIRLLDNTVSEMTSEKVLPEMKWMLLDTVLYVADSPEKFPFNVRQSILEAALGCAVFGAQRAMLQNRLFKAWDGACWEVDVHPKISLTGDTVANAPNQCSYGVYVSERLQGEHRTHTRKAFPNHIVDGTKQRPTDADKSLTTGVNRDFSHWWHNREKKTRRAFVMSEQVAWDSRVKQCQDDILMGMPETFV